MSFDVSKPTFGSRPTAVGRWLVRMFAVDFVCFLLLTIYLGGSAFNGKVVADHYYVGPQWREVDRSVFMVSWITCYSVILLFAAALIAEAWGRRGSAPRNLGDDRFRAMLVLVGLPCCIVLILQAPRLFSLLRMIGT
jgi:hypothetical protein